MNHFSCCSPCKWRAVDGVNCTVKKKRQHSLPHHNSSPVQMKLMESLILGEFDKLLFSLVLFHWKTYFLCSDFIGRENSGGLRHREHHVMLTTRPQVNRKKPIKGCKWHSLFKNIRKDLCVQRPEFVLKLVFTSFWQKPRWKTINYLSVPITQLHFLWGKQIRKQHGGAANDSVRSM